MRLYVLNSKSNKTYLQKHKTVESLQTFKWTRLCDRIRFVNLGEKPYRCPIPGCNRAFPQQSNLNHHLRNHDKPAPPPENTCSLCMRTYASETVLRSHISKVTFHKMFIIIMYTVSNLRATLLKKPRSFLFQWCISLHFKLVSLHSKFVSHIPSLFEIGYTCIWNFHMTMKYVQQWLSFYKSVISVTNFSLTCPKMRVCLFLGFVLWWVFVIPRCPTSSCMHACVRQIL